jgi:exopolyphosphatase/guanosine-5'-triphosphate,3'-diphosphate pyrophosphatase
MGSIRLPEQAVVGKTKNAEVQTVLKRSIHSVAKSAASEFSLDKIDTFIALGGDMRFAARQLVENAAESFVAFDNKVFQKFVNTLSKLSPEEIVDQYGVPYGDAEVLYPALLYYSNFLSETKAESVLVPMVTIRDGLLLELAQMFSGYKRTDVSKQVINSARHLGQKYKYDEAHALVTAALSVKLFDGLKEDHGLGPKERLLLEVSAILHDIGTYISVSGHHKHSSYLVDAADIFGLRKSDKNIVSNVVRYHRRQTPQPTHVPYMSLPKADRSTVSKLAAILRVADALDRSHQQKIRNFTLERAEDVHNLWVDEEVGDVSLEREGLLKKADMFTEVFGAQVALKQGKPVKAS